MAELREGSSVGLIIGIVVALLVIIGVVIFVVIRRRNQNKKVPIASNEHEKLAN